MKRIATAAPALRASAFTETGITRGFSIWSKPNLRRKLGGRGTVPRLLMGTTVIMQQCSIAAMQREERGGRGARADSTRGFDSRGSGREGRVWGDLGLGS